MAALCMVLRAAVSHTWHGRLPDVRHMKQAMSNNAEANEPQQSPDQRSCHAVLSMTLPYARHMAVPEGDALVSSQGRSKHSPQA